MTLVQNAWRGRRVDAFQWYARILLSVTLLMAVLLVGASEMTPMKLAMSVLISVLLGSAVLVAVTRRLPGLLQCWALFGLWVAVNFLTALSNDVPMFEWARRASLVLCWPAAAILCYSAIKTEKDIWWVYRMVVAILLLPLLVGAWVLFGSENLEAFRFGTAWHEGVGHFACLILVFVTPFLDRRFFTNVLALLASAVFLAAGVRSLLLAFCLGLLAYPISLRTMGREVWRPTRYIRLVGVIALATFILLQCAPVIFQEMVGRYERLRSITSNSFYLDRIEESSEFLENIFNKPIIAIVVGNGAGATFDYPSYYHHKNRIVPMDGTYSHNYYLLVFWGYGLTGLGLFMIGSLYTIRSLLESAVGSSDLTERMRIGLLLAFAVSAMAAVASTFYDLVRWYVLFGILTGMAAAISQRRSGRLSKRTAIVRSER